MRTSNQPVEPNKPIFQSGRTYDQRRGRAQFQIRDIVSTPLGDGRFSHLYICTDGRNGEEVRLTEAMATQRLRTKSKGDLVWLSASQIDNYKRCPRRWAYVYIDGRLEPESPEMKWGTEVHAVLEHYLKTGLWVGAEDAVATAQQGKHILLPKIGAVEAALSIPISGHKAKIVGFIDWLIPAATRMAVCHDHKTGKNLKWVKTEQDLLEDTQANIYSYEALRRFKGKEVLARWAYYAAEPGPKPSLRPRKPNGWISTLRIKSEAEIKEQMNILGEHCVEMIGHQRNLEAWADDIPGNPFACDDFKGCPHRSYCPSGQSRTIGDLIEQSHGPDTRGERKETEGMSSLLDIIRNAQAQNGAAAPPAAPPTPPAAAPPAAAPPAAAPPAAAPPPPAAAPPPAEVSYTDHTAEADATVNFTSTAPAAGAPSAPPAPAAAVAPSLAEAAKAAEKVPINPPAVPPTELPPELSRATEPAIPESWLKRAAKGQKPRAAGEAEWRATLEASNPQETPAAAPAAAAPPAAAPAAASAAAPAAAPAPAAATPVGSENALFPFVVVLDAAVLKGTASMAGATNLSAFLRPHKEAIQTESKLPHWNLLKYREGETRLAALLEQQLKTSHPAGVVYCDSRSEEWKACGSVLEEYADIVIKGV